MIGFENELLEREHELALLDQLVREAGAGESALIVVEGPAGIGKSRLLQAVRERARTAGFRTLTARGSDLERGLAYGVVRQLFEVALAQPDDRGRWLTGSALAAARVFDPAEVGTSSDDAGFSVLYGLSWLTVNIAAEGPLLLAIDDLQWSDRASLRFVAYLMRRLEGLGVLLAATLRRGDPHADAWLLDGIAQDGVAVSIHPRGLTEAAVAELVRRRLGADPDPAFAAACRAATGGNPLLLGEVLRTMQAERIRPDAAHLGFIRDVGPRAVSRTVLLRLARLPADAISVARAVAVLGDDAGLPETATVSGLSEERVATATRSLAAAGILRAESPLAFVHPLVREYVYLELAPAERELGHERAARALTALGAPLERIASHLVLVPCRSDASTAASLHQAGRASMQRADPEAAVTYLQRALAEPPGSDQQPSLLIDLGTAEALTNDMASAGEHLRRGYASVVEPTTRATVAETLARVLLFSAPASEAATVARHAADELPAELDDLRWRLEALELFAVCFGAPVSEAVPRLERARDGLRGEGPGARMLAAVAASDWALSGGSAAECCALAEAALADGVLVAADPAPMGTIAASVLDLADREDVAAIWQAARAAAHRSGSALALAGIDVCEGASWLLRGELTEAEATLRRANGQTVPWDSAAAEVSYGHGFMAQILIGRGDVSGARQVLSGLPPAPSKSDADTVVRRAETELLLAERRWEDARAGSEGLTNSLRERVVNPAWAPWRSLRAEALLGLERPAEARELLAQELVWARRWGAPAALGRTLRLLGTAGRRPDFDALGEAVEVTGRSAARLEHARALIELGAALRRTRKPSDARDPLRRGLELAARCGAAPLADRARTELYAAGGRPQRDALRGPDSLTPSERRVAKRAADGLSNREIAQELYVTLRTVEYHLTSVYRKLEISARARLPDALAREAA